VIARGEPLSRVCLIYSYLSAVTFSSAKCVCTGDKTGSIGLFDASGLLSSSASAPFDARPRVLRFAPHTKPVSAMRFDRGGRLITASYDGSLRRTDFSAARSASACAELYVHDDEENLHSFCAASAGDVDHTYWVSDGKGGVALVDARQSGAQNAAAVRTLSTHKIGSIDVHPTNANLLATASNSHYVTLWDVRRLPARVAAAAAAATSASLPKGVVAAFKHTKACTAAYFSPTGHALLTTSYDNTCHLIRCGDEERVTDSVCEWRGDFCSLFHVVPIETPILSAVFCFVSTS
jgi:WD40 repeat protein